jgi:hypothetical protein
MSSRAETEVNQLRVSLEKALASEGSTEGFEDAIAALQKIPISIDLLRKTKIGQTLQDVKKKHATNNVGVLAKALLSKWKKDCESTSASNGVEEVVKKVVDKPAAAVAQAPAKSPRNSNEDEEFVDESHYDKLSAIRKKVME